MEPCKEDKSVSEIQTPTMKTKFRKLSEANQYSPNLLETNFKLKAACRAYQARKCSQSTKLSQAINIAFQTSPSREITGPLRYLDSVPDYTNVRTSRVVRNLTDFEYPDREYEYKGVKLINREAVDIEKGVIYIGQWTEDNQRHGKGKQLWPDGSVY